jgi:Protein of unknown function (DUF429)
MDAYAGIDVAFAKRKPLPVTVCARRDGRLVPLPLRAGDAPQPPRGQGNVKTLDPAVLAGFAEETVQYLRAIENRFDVSIVRVGIDAPSDPRRDDATRREAEVALDGRRISFFTTPSAQQFRAIQVKVETHLAGGGPVSRMPHANQLWMLVGFELFRRLRLEWECLEVFPQATVALLGVGGVHKSRKGGIEAQLAAVARLTGWPTPPNLEVLAQVGHGRLHDRLDAYLAAWVASLDLGAREPLGCPLNNDVIWVPRFAG